MDGEDRADTTSTLAVDLSTHVDSAIHICARLGDVDGLREAVKDKHNDVNSIGLYRWSALHEACANSDEAVVTILLEGGAKPWLLDALHSRTALHYAAEAGDKDVLDLVIRHCSSNGMKIEKLIEMRDDEGKSALDIASEVLVAEERAQRLMSARQPIDKAATISSQQSISREKPPVVNKLLRSPGDRAADCSEEETITLPGQDLSDLHESRKGFLELTQQQLVNGTVYDGPVKSGPDEDVTSPRMQMSFEHNAKTGRLKVRIRQLSNMPRLNALLSSSNRFYVKSFIEPDPDETTKRKTEKVAIPPMPEPDQALPQEFDVIPPLTFHEPLHYENIGVVNNTRAIRLSVCCHYGQWVTSSAELAFVSVPLHKAVQSLMPQWYQLQLRQTLNKFAEHDNRVSVKPGRVYGIAKSGMVPNTAYTLQIRNNLASGSLSECVDVSTSEEDLDELSQMPELFSNANSLVESVSTEECLLIRNHKFDDEQPSLTARWGANIKRGSCSSVSSQELQAKNHSDDYPLEANKLASKVRPDKNTEHSPNVINITHLVQTSESNPTPLEPEHDICGHPAETSSKLSSSLSQSNPPKHLFRVQLSDRRFTGKRKENTRHHTTRNLGMELTSEPIQAASLNPSTYPRKVAMPTSQAQHSPIIHGNTFEQQSGSPPVACGAQLGSVTSTRNLFQVRAPNNTARLPVKCDQPTVTPCYSTTPLQSEVISISNPVNQMPLKSGRTAAEVSRNPLRVLGQTAGQMFGRLEHVFSQRQEQSTSSHSTGLPPSLGPSDNSISPGAAKASCNTWIQEEDEPEMVSATSDSEPGGTSMPDLSITKMQPSTVASQMALESVTRFAAFSNTSQRLLAGSNPFVVDMEPLMKSQTRHSQSEVGEMSRPNWEVSASSGKGRESMKVGWQQQMLPGAAVNTDEGNFRV